MYAQACPGRPGNVSASTNIIGEWEGFSWWRQPDFVTTAMRGGTGFIWFNLVRALQIWFSLSFMDAIMN